MKLLKILTIISMLFFPIAEVGKIQLGSISFTVNDILVFITFFSWTILAIKNKKLPKAFLVKPVLIFIFIAAISLIINLYRLNLNSFFVAGLYLFRWIMYSSFYFILVDQDKKFIEKFKYLLLIPITTILILGLIQFSFYQSLRNLYYLGWDEHLYRLFASFLDPNFAGAFLVMSFMFVFHFLLETYQKKNYKFLTFLSIIAAINFVEIYLTFSRSALIMLALCLITYLVLIGKKRIIFVFALLLVLLAIFSPKSFQTEGTNLFRVFSSEQRIESAQAAIKIIQKNPIIGVGFNAYRYVMFDYGIVNDAKWETTHSGAGTDNSFLFVLATTGIFGLLAYLFLLYKTYFLAKLKLKKNRFGIVVIAVLTGLIVDSFFVNSLFYVYVMEFLWIYIAITENS